MGNFVAAALVRAKHLSAAAEQEEGADGLRRTDLPPGWRTVLHRAPSKAYKKYVSASGDLKARSCAEAWRLHEGVGEGSAGNKSGDDGDEDASQDQGSINCPLCDIPDSDDTVVCWLQCDACLTWCHAGCAGLDDASASRLGGFTCPLCRGTCRKVAATISGGGGEDRPNDAEATAESSAAAVSRRQGVH